MLFSRSEEKKIPENITETYHLLKKGYNLDEIAKLRSLDEAIISMQIETIISIIPELNIDRIIPPEKIEIVKKYYLQGFGELKMLKKKIAEELNINFTISELRIALAKIKKENSI